MVVQHFVRLVVGLLWKKFGKRAVEEFKEFLRPVQDARVKIRPYDNRDAQVLVSLVRALARY